MAGVAFRCQSCKGNAVHVKMTKKWHVTNSSPRYRLLEVLLEIGRFEG
jgi:hypothetical protein